jgi:hypothetical protein
LPRREIEVNSKAFPAITRRKPTQRQNHPVFPLSGPISTICFNSCSAQEGFGRRSDQFDVDKAVGDP